MLIFHGRKVSSNAPMKVAPAGDRAILVTLPEASASGLRAAADRVRAIDGVEACVIGHESLLVVSLRPPLLIANAIANAEEGRSPNAKAHVIEVSFNGEYALDLPSLPRDEILARIAEVRLEVRFLGFRPGFAYLDGWPEAWRLPRRPTSRNKVPFGSFAIAGAFAGFYAVDSPGGWNILGRTVAPLWDPRREPPNLLAPGDTIAIVPTLDKLQLTPPRNRETQQPSNLYDVISPGQLTTIVEKRDWRKAEHGEPPGGPFDLPAAIAANRAAGNDDDAPLFECVLVGPRLRFREAARAAWCGGNGVVRVYDIRKDEEINIGRIHGGLRGYLAIGKKAGPVENVARGEPRVIRVMRGPHDSPFVDSDWEVTPQLDRAGIRLRPLGTPVTSQPADLPSCGMQFGTVQWHPDGSLIVMGPDHPVTGGYLQPATVLSDDLWKLAQLAPADRVRLECGGKATAFASPG